MHIRDVENVTNRIRHPVKIDTMKKIEKLRMLRTNPKGFKLEDKENVT